MRYGLTVLVRRDGPKVPSYSMRTVGVRDNGSCWGVWINSTPDPSGFFANEHLKPHLLISAIHPQSWPYAFRAQLRLAHHPGAMAAASRAFLEQGINIIFAECAESGFHHATWNIIGEALDLRRQTSPLYEEILREVDPEKRKRKAALITQKLLSLLPQIMESVQISDLRQGKPFLRTRFSIPKLCSFEEEYFSDQEVWRTHEGRISRQITYSILPNLTFFFRHSMSAIDPIRFHYKEQSEVLVADEESAFQDEVSEKGLAVPTKAIVSFDTDEQTIRLHFLERSQLPKVFDLNVDYRLKLNTPEHPEIVSSIGLVERIASATESAQLNMLSMQSSITSQDRGSEAGYVQVFGEVEGVGPEGAPRAKRAIEMAVESISLPGLNLKVAVKALALEKIFLSMHFSAARSKGIKEVIAEQVDSMGFQLVWCKDEDFQAVTEEVAQKMRECAGFIQVLTCRQGNQDPHDIEWLISEYFGAITLGLKTLIFADISVQTEEDWRAHLKIARDRPLYPFNSRGDDMKRVLKARTRRFLRNWA